MDKEKLAKEAIEFRPITGEDNEFLYHVYASTRAEEMALTGWKAEEIEAFLRSQFHLQHVQYMENYKQNGSFDIILVKGEPAGRLYIQRKENDIRIVDIALLPGYRGLGVGTKIMKELMAEADQKKIQLSLHVEQFNPALGLYERLGFEKKDLIGIYYFMVRRAAGSECRMLNAE
ncbi:MAG: GNAT family N-acetyltransferase [Acidobacteria bacterium]|jgi:ribosomal protein S18 acetylase RimI-like enzyme|nr:GNAT family N-acetyltransferase [Acidobacteriota bacterium]